MKRTYEEINEKIRNGDAVVMTAEEVISLVETQGVERAAAEVDVVTTGTFGAMCSSGAFLNFGHSDPPIKMGKVWLNDVPAYTGIAAVDCYIGATEMMEGDGEDYGGAHVIEDLIAGKAVKMRAQSDGTDCYPRKDIESYVSLDTLNEAYMFNPRNAYQNYAVGVNSSNKTLYTYMGKLLPRFGNATYSSAGQLSPLMNDPHCETIGLGTRIFLGGGQGYVSWQGTQYNTTHPEKNGVPVGNSRTLAVIGDLKGMSTDYIRALSVHKYGISIAVGIGVPIPILNEDIMRGCAVKDEDIFAPVIDYSVQSRRRKTMAEVSYAELRSGSVELFDRKVKTSSLSSYPKAKAIANELKRWMVEGEFELTRPVAPLPSSGKVKPLNISTREELE